MKTHNIKLSAIKPNPDQPRRRFTGISALARAIATEGLVNPITVIEKNGDYMIVAGERRYRAFCVLHKVEQESQTTDYIWGEIPCVITDNEGAKALAENEGRKQLEFWETSLEVVRLLECGLSRTEVAKRIGRDTSYVSRCVTVGRGLASKTVEFLEKTRDSIDIDTLLSIAKLTTSKEQISAIQRHFKKAEDRKGTRRRASLSKRVHTLPFKSVAKELRIPEYKVRAIQLHLTEHLTISDALKKARKEQQ